MNVVSVAGELLRPTTMRASKIAFRSAITQLTFYIVIGISGYLSFGQTVNQNFMTNYPANDHLIVMCRFLLTLTIFFALPINTNPTANAFVHLLPGASQSTVDTAASLEDPLVAPLVDTQVEEPFQKIRIGMAIYVLLQGMVVAIYAPGVADVISVLGGSFGTLIMLVCPALIYCRVFAEEMNTAKARVMIGLLLGASLISLCAVICTIMHKI